MYTYGYDLYTYIVFCIQYAIHITHMLNPNHLDRIAHAEFICVVKLSLETGKYNK